MVLSPALPVELADIEAAAGRLEAIAIKTPLLESDVVNAITCARVLVKAECLQRTGAFKIRGAYNRISQFDEAQRAAGVVAYSSGNHAQGVARAARLLGVRAQIVMPADAPSIKTANTKADGATVIPYDRRDANRVAIATEIAERTSAVLVPPYDDLHVMAGQGTIGLEIAQQTLEMGINVDAVLGPCSGGGMVGGSAVALKALSPETKIYSVEPKGFDDTVRSLVAGKRIEIEPPASSICDALLIETPGKLTFEVTRRLLAGGLTVSDASVRTAMGLAFDALKVVLEPSGAIGLAALLEDKQRFAGKTVVVIATGGNVDRHKFKELLG